MSSGEELMVEEEEKKNYYRGLTILGSLFADVFTTLFIEKWNENHDRWEDGETFGKKLNKIYVDYKKRNGQKLGQNNVTDDRIKKGQTKTWDLSALHRVYAQYQIMEDKETIKFMTKIKDLRNAYNHDGTRSLRRTTKKYKDDLRLFEEVFEYLKLDMDRLRGYYSLKLTDSGWIKLAEDATVNAVIIHEENEEETTEALRLAERLNNSIMREGMNASVVAEVDVVLPGQSYMNGLSNCLTEYETVFIFVNPDSQSSLGKFKRSVAQFNGYVKKGYRCAVVLTHRNIEEEDDMPIDMSYKNIKYFKYAMTDGTEREFLKWLQN